MSIIGDIVGCVLIPHILAFFFLFRIATLEIRADEEDTVRENMARLWAWVCVRWTKMIIHPLYWAASGVVTAFFLVEPLRRIFT